jgi:hypothetical protein
MSDDQAERNRHAIRRWVDEVINEGKLEVVDEIFAPSLAEQAKQWVAPFRASFTHVRMRVVDLVAEPERVVGRFLCSGTHTGEWLGHPATGRRFEDVDEVYFFTFRGGLVVESWGIEDNLRRMAQLGLP